MLSSEIRNNRFYEIATVRANKQSSTGPEIHQYQRPFTFRLSGRPGFSDPIEGRLLL